MKNILVSIGLVIALLHNQILNWKSKIQYSIRFFLCGVSGYLAFSIFTPLKSVLSGREDEFIYLFFEGVGPAILGVLVLVLAFYGLALSVISASLFKSLLPGT